MITCAGEQVVLSPFGEYARERIQILYGTTTRPAYRDILINNRKAPPEPDLQYLSAERSTRCDSEGRFTFKDVAPGNYFITTSIFWQVVEFQYQGGDLMYPVTFTGEGETMEVILSQ